MKILVTGADGYLGQGVVKKLCDNGHKVIATSISEKKDIDKRAIWKFGNIFDFENPYVELGTPDVVLHMAWKRGFVHNDITHINDLPKHYKFLRLMAESGITKLAVMGSMHEVGFFEGSINENTPTNPESLYGISKDALRNMTHLICKENDIIFQWLRGYYIVGNTDMGSSIFSKIVQAEKRGDLLFPFTTGQNQWDFLEYNDFVEQVVATVEQDSINGIINICSGMPERLSDRVEKFIKDNKFNIKLDYGKFPDRPYDSKAVWGDNKKILKILNNRSKV